MCVVVFLIKMVWYKFIPNLELIGIYLHNYDTFLFLARLSSWPGLFLWTESLVYVCQCDERKLYRRHYGSRQRKVWFLYRPCFGNKLQYIYRREFHLKEERTPSTGQEGLDASRYVSFCKLLILMCQKIIRSFARGLTGMGWNIFEMFYLDTPVQMLLMFQLKGAAEYRSLATHFL